MRQRVHSRSGLNLVVPNWERRRGFIRLHRDEGGIWQGLGGPGEIEGHNRIDNGIDLHIGIDIGIDSHNGIDFPFEIDIPF